MRFVMHRAVRHLYWQLTKANGQNKKNYSNNYSLEEHLSYSYFMLRIVKCLLEDFALK